MLNVNIICIGKLKESYLRDACAEYEKRLDAFCRLTVTQIAPAKLPDSPGESLIERALSQEGKLILAALPPNSRAYALCIEGKALTSPELSKLLEADAVAGSGSVSFIIGGSHGLSAEVKKRSNLCLSMSAMTFPHQLARVMLLEQLYRAFMISSGGKYHK